MEDSSQPAVQLSHAAKPVYTTGAGIKDTIESILVAFILAFVFRAFVVEAFVIPTGSMATTLLGAHTRFHCPDCGYDFDVNYQAPPSAVRNSANPEAEDPDIPSTAGVITDPIYCPNCGFPMPSDQKNNPPVSYGDRILVLKYLYQLEKPQRWDVVVFKAPVFDMTTNYIKRLIATPGESVMVLDGDVYIREPGSKDFVVQPKPPQVQNALWRLVYDNDYLPQKMDRDQSDRMGVAIQPWVQPWQVIDGAGWNLNDPATQGKVREFDFTGDNSSSRMRFNPDANPTAQSTSDYLVYDQQNQSGIPQREANRNSEIPVSDLDLRVTYQRQAGSGPLRLSLGKRDHTFTAEITPTQAALFQDFGGTHSQIGVPMQLNGGERPLRIELSNADYRVTLRVDDQFVAQSTPADFKPDFDALLREFDDNRTPPPGFADISAANQHCRLSHISLWRDLYYTNKGGRLRATPEDFPHNVVTLGKDEYFVMGDNTALSWDARWWPNGVSLPAEDLQVEAGRVPGRFLLGKAFYVYWPAGYPVNSSLPAFVPNFGSMRFIH